MIDPLRSTALLAIAAAALLSGCLSYDREAAAAVSALQSGSDQTAVKWGIELSESAFSERLGEVEAGRIELLVGNAPAAEVWFRHAIDGAIDRSECEPLIKLCSIAQTALASTVADDRSIDYTLSPYEINLALEYGILAQLFNGRREDARVDARLSAYVQDKLTKTYGADLEKRQSTDDQKTSDETSRIMTDQSKVLDAMIAATRNSWENPVLWWLSGVLFEADGDLDGAVQSYRRAAAIAGGNPVFAGDLRRADSGGRAPDGSHARLVVIAEDGFVPRRAALKIPLRIYATMSIDIPTYANAAPYQVRPVVIDGLGDERDAVFSLDVRALAARDLKEDLPGIIVRNITRAALNVGVQAAGKNTGNSYVRLGAELVNLVLLAVRQADTRSWVTLPDAQYVWRKDDVKPGEHHLAISVGSCTGEVDLALRAGETGILWVSACGATLRHKFAIISGK